VAGAKIVWLPGRDGRRHADDGPFPETADRVTHERDDRWITVLCAAVRPPTAVIRRGVADDILRRWTLQVLTNVGELSNGEVVMFGNGLEPGFLAEFRGEDHAGRAVRTADSIRRSLATVQRDVPPSERYGVASGLASAQVAELTLPSGQVRWMGRALPNALRLQEFAGPDQVFVTEQTRRALGDGFRTTRVGEVAGGHDWGTEAWSLAGMEA
jgi:class 3 adenylate cyclase